MASDGEQPFEEFIRSRTGADFVERRWLRQSIESALEPDSCRFVLVTGEPGVGKTTLMCGLASEHRDWLRYFVDQNDGTSHITGDVMSFLLSVGHQLAWQYPEAFDQQRLEVIVDQRVKRVSRSGKVVGIRIGDLTVSPFFRAAALKVEQRAKRVDGWLSAAEIGSLHLEPRFQDPVNLIHLALIDPAQVLLEKNPDARIVILLDSLDSATRSGVGDALLDLLSGRDGVGLPANVRMVITSRQDDELDLVRTGRRGHLDRIQLDLPDERVDADLAAYARRSLTSPGVERAIENAGMMPDQFHRRLAAHASGNFQYLESYARALTDAVRALDDAVLALNDADSAEFKAVAAERGDIIARLLRLDSFPSDLAGIYAFFASIVHTDIKRLGEQKVEYRLRLSDTDKAVPSWEGVGQPVLGLLTVAREPLSLDQLIKMAGIRVERLSVRNVLDRLSWLLDSRDDKKIAFYHASIGEFLASDRADQECHYSWVDETDWHKLIVRHYRESAKSWGEVDWSAVDHYGLAHLAWHTARCSPEDEDPLKAIELACSGLRKASRAAFGSDQHFFRLLDLLSKRAIEHFPITDALPAVIRLGTARRQVRRSSINPPPAVLGLLTRMGRVQEAVESIKALPPSRRRFVGASEILRYARKQQRGTAHMRELVDLLVESALGVPVPGGYDHRQALKRAAQEIAPYDLDRALHLWTRAQPGTAREGAEAPDPVYRAAAEGTIDVAQARVFIDSLHSGQAIAWLDLAARADPAEVPDLLGIAEDALSGAGHAERLRCLGRLAAAWTPIEAEQVSHLVRSLKDEATGDASDKHGHAEGLAGAAAELAVTHPAIASWLLELLENPIVIEPSNDARSPAFRAARVWAAHGSSQKAQQLVDRLLTNSRDIASDLAIASEVISTFDPAAGWQLAEAACAKIPAGPRRRGDHRRDSQLKDAATALARHDPHRAIEIANQISVTDWEYYQHVEGLVYDRGSMLAQLAHLHLDSGNNEFAEEILGGLLASQEGEPVLSGESPSNVFFRQVEDPQLKLRAVETARRIERREPFEWPEPRSAELAAFWCSNPTMEEQVGRLDYEMGHAPISGEKEIAIMQWFKAMDRWRVLRKDRFYREPAGVIRAMMTAPSRPANPYSWARAFRVLAEEVAAKDQGRAYEFVSALSGGERLVGLAALMEGACLGERDPLHYEFQQQLPEVECYEWLLDSKDDEPFAFIRPDHRARFEAATRLLPIHSPVGELALGGGGAYYLSIAYQSVKRTKYSEEYMSAVLGQRPQRAALFREYHGKLLRGELQVGDPLLDDVTLATVVAHEYLAASASNRPVTRPTRSIDDPVYAALVGLLVSQGKPGGRAVFASQVREMLRSSRLPAVAGLLAYVAELMPGDIGWLRELGEELLARAAGRRPKERIAAVLPLAVSTPLYGLVDPLELLNQVNTLDLDEVGSPETGEELVELFPALLARHPASALQLVYEDLASNWDRAMALLESGAKHIIDILGVDAPTTLHQAIRKGLECSSRDGSAPDTVDGVKINQDPTRLVALEPW